MKNAARILETFVCCFEPDSGYDTTLPVVVAQETDVAVLKAFYSDVPVRFPALYEQLVLGYRWNQAATKLVRLLANPIGEDLSGLKKEIMKDSFLYDVCVKNGFVQFGLTATGLYDPVFFDLNKKSKGRIVVLDHEEILGKSRAKVQIVLSEDFETLVLNVIQTHSAGPKTGAH